jgi:hypothetical protein
MSVHGHKFHSFVADVHNGVAVRIPEIFQQLSAFKRCRDIGKHYQQRHTQKKRKGNDSVAFGTANNIVCGKESRRAKPRFSKAHNAFFAEAFPCLPVPYSVDRGHFAHPARTTETEQENHSRCQNRAGNVYKSVIAAVYYNRLRGITYKHFPEWVAEYQAECCADNGNGEVFCKVQPPNFYVPYAYGFHNAYLAEFFREGKGYGEPQYRKGYDDKNKAHRKDKTHDYHVKNIGLTQCIRATRKGKAVGYIRYLGQGLVKVGGVYV